MKVFEDIDIEFFDINVKKPNNLETVIVVLKDTTSMTPSYYKKATPEGKKCVTKAIFKEFKTVPPKFTDRGEYYTYTYTMDEVICWGRLKE